MVGPKNRPKILFQVCKESQKLGFFLVVVLNKEYSLYIHALAIVYFLFEHINDVPTYFNVCLCHG